MFSKDEGYAFDYKGSRKECDGELCFRRHTFTFKTRQNQTYIVELDEFEEFVLFVIKFYLKNHRLSENKFKLMTNLNEAPGILTTCVNIMVSKSKENPYASFGFIGANSESESKNNTKRFRLYSKVMNQLISPIDYTHYQMKQSSTYLMINKNFAKNNDGYLVRLESYFNRFYHLL